MGGFVSDYLKCNPINLKVTERNAKVTIPETSANALFFIPSNCSSILWGLLQQFHPENDKSKQINAGIWNDGIKIVYSLEKSMAGTLKKWGWMEDEFPWNKYLIFIEKNCEFPDSIAVYGHWFITLDQIIKLKNPLFDPGGPGCTPLLSKTSRLSLIQKGTLQNQPTAVFRG